MKQRLLGKTPEELRSVALEAGLPKFAAGQMTKWLYQKKVRSIDEMTDISKAGRAALNEKYEVGVTGYSQVQVSSDGTKKYLFPVEDELSPVAGSRADITREFDVPLSENTPGAMYVYAQSSGGVTVAVDAVIDGRQVTLTKPLPKDMERNRIALRLLK